MHWVLIVWLGGILAHEAPTGAFSVRVHSQEACEQMATQIKEKAIPGGYRGHLCLFSREPFGYNQ